jgi:hypothetical protein
MVAAIGRVIRMNEIEPMVRIPITVEAFEAVIATVPLGTIVYEPDLTPNGERLVWAEKLALDELEAMRRPGETHSDVILRLVEMERGLTNQ